VFRFPKSVKKWFKFINRLKNRFKNGLSIPSALMILQQRQMKGYSKNKEEGASEGINTQPAQNPYPLYPPSVLPTQIT
jgi:hypothetical protein